MNQTTVDSNNYVPSYRVGVTAFQAKENELEFPPKNPKAITISLGEEDIILRTESHITTRDHNYKPVYRKNEKGEVLSQDFGGLTEKEKIELIAYHPELSKVFGKRKANTKNEGIEH